MTARKRPPSIVIEPGAIDATHRQRFAAKILRTPGGCHRWIAARNSSGYGVFRLNGVQAGSNLYIFPDGRRACRECQRKAQRRYAERKAEVAS